MIEAVRRFAAAMGRDALINGLAASALLPRPVRHRMLRAYGLRLGRVAIAPGTFFGGADITIGDGTVVNYGCFFDNSGRITIGERCSIGMEVALLTSHHESGGPRRRALESTTGRPITIGDGSWIGARATILPGVTIGHGCIVGAGAVVTADCDPDGFYAGNPARRVRELGSEEPQVA